MGPLPQHPIVTAGGLLAERGSFGILWLDADLNVVERYGRLVDFVPPNRPVAEALLPLIGLDEQIKAVADGERGVLEMPGVSIRAPGAPQHRLNITVLWAAAEQRFLVLVARASSESDIEMHLAQQMRARLMAEADATALARQLARANRDLEEFASIISHDLRAPMRAMRYLTEDAETALASGEVALAQARLSRVREQSLRLTTMLAALFDYSRAGYKQDVVARVELKVLVDAIVRSLSRREGLRIDIEGDWPAIETLAAPLDLVVRNLIDNAIKHHDRTEMRIIVSCREQADAMEITITDDGPGIDPRHHAAILLPFRRLSGDHDPASSGMGLALVKRTIEAVGGRLQIESDPAVRRGAAFQVIWPRAIGEAQRA